MNYSPRITLAVLALSSLTLFSSCVKEYDYVKQHPGAEVTGCRIVMMINPADAIKLRADTFRLDYNAHGDLTGVTDTAPGIHSYQGDYHFVYDKYNRLKDYFWGSPSYSDYRLIWHRYTYISKSLVSDSQFNYIEHGGGPNPPLENFAYVSIDSLDTEGRIVKIYDLHNPSSFSTFQYDAKGNLTINGAVYDNKLNMFHTSHTWMFVQQDFSVNNRLNWNYANPPVQITSYNAAGLPLLWQVAPNAPYFGGETFGGIVYHKLQIVYDCDIKNVGL